MSAQDFLQRVEQTGLVSTPLLAELRKRVAESRRPIRPEVLAKLLVDRGVLTGDQARKLVSQALAAEEARRSDEELGLMPLDDEPEPQVVRPVASELTLIDDEDELQLIDEDELQVVGNDDDLEVIDEPLLPVQMDLDGGVPMAELDEPMAPAIIGPEEHDTSLDDLLRDPLLSDDEATSGAAPLESSRRGIGTVVSELFRPRRPRANRWDSPLLLVGGGTLIVLVALGLFLLLYLIRGSGEEYFAKADEFYRSGSYNQAIANFDRFLNGFSSHPKASLARVKRGLAQLRQVADKSEDWESALRTAGQVLPTIENEEAFGEARPDLAGLLPRIAAGLTQQAKSAQTADDQQRLVALAKDSLELVDNSNYLPTSVRNSVQGTIEEVEAEIEVVVRNIKQEQQLATVVDQIRATAQQRRIAESYELRDTLLKEYPALEDRDELKSAEGIIVSQEREAVETFGVDFRPQQDDHPPPTRVHIILGDRRGQLASGLDGHVLFVLARGAVYGLDAANGNVLWRRYVGYETTVYPQPVDERPGSDVVLVDGARNELVRRAAADGKLVWRLPVGETISHPVVLTDRILVAAGNQQTGQLLVVDPASGAVKQAVRFPLGISGFPALDGKRREIYQPAVHSSLYVLDLDTLKCKQVVPLNHGRGSIRTAAVSAGGYLIAAENPSTDFSWLHVCTVDAEDQWSVAKKPIRLEGRVIAPLQAEGRRLMVATDRGAVHLFDAVGGSSGQRPREIAKVTPSFETSQVGFPLLGPGSVWLAGQGLVRYQVQATRGQLLTKWSRDNDDVFLGPLQRIGAHLFHWRQRKGMLGATVAAARISDAGGQGDGEPVWQTDIGAPLTGGPVVEAESVSAITANGACFSIGPDAVRSGRSNQRADRIDERLLTAALERRVALSNGKLLLSSTSPNQQYVLAELRSRKNLEVRRLKTQAHRPTAPLVSFRQWVLAACDTGPVFLIDPETGEPATVPFQPPMEVGTRMQWLQPTGIDGTDEFVAATRNGELYRIGVQPQPQPNAAIQRQSRLKRELSAGLAAVGSTVFAVAPNISGGDVVVAIDAGTLALGKEWPLRGRVAWGPERVGEVVVVCDDTGQTLCLQSDQQLRWQIEHSFGPLAGPPLVLGNDLIFASTRGSVWLVDETGQLKGQHDIGEPLGSGPSAFRDRLLLSGWDGTVYLTNVPGR